MLAMNEKYTLSSKDRADIAQQMKRYEKECGEVIVMKVDPAVLKQMPVAVVSRRRTGVMSFAHA